MRKTISYILYKKGLHLPIWITKADDSNIVCNPDRWAKDVIEKPIDYLKDKYPLIYYIDRYIFENWYVVPLFIILTIIYVLFRL